MTRDSWEALVTALAIALVSASCGSGGDGGEETVEMISGSYRTVAEGRAEILVGEIGGRMLEENGPTVDAVGIEVTCAEERKVVWATEDRLTEPVCRIQLQLEEITDWAPAKARLRVVWEAP